MPGRHAMPGETPEDYLRRVDPVLAKIVDDVIRAEGTPLSDSPDTGVPDLPSEHYGVLLRAIVGQNISNLAAQAIFRRIVERYGGRAPTPEELLADEPDELRTAVGLSHAKTASLRSLAEHVISGELELDKLPDLPDDEVVAQLTAIKGIGRWTAEIFLIFHLRRPDVLAVGDLEIRRTVETAYGLSELPKPAEVEELGKAWRPQRTLAGLYLWRWRAVRRAEG
ncbi:DNA-3-methyladenine glycosylase family protein [Kribbella sp. NPDC051586]|uniref:DNA-3-methyladenine glycosylase family protein n=1 Tax=Kribbella sp. NPDC051586 TaxID=3364118 RepID=UPI003793D351